MNRRGFLKMIGVTTASVVVAGEHTAPDYKMKINLEGIDRDAVLFIIKEDVDCVLENAEFSGLVKDYDPSNGYNEAMLVRIRKVGLKPYEFRGCMDIHPVMMVDTMFSSDYEVVVDANGASIGEVYEKIKIYTKRNLW